MQMKGFAMFRKIVLAAFLALVVSVVHPVWASEVDQSETVVSDTVELKSTEAEVVSNDETLLDKSAFEQPLALGLSPSDALTGFGPSSGTVVGNRALELRDEVLRLRSSVNLNANEFALLRANGAAGAVQYHSTVAAITARLQNGTTRGNPILLRQWDEAESSLNEVTNSLYRLNSLQTSVAADASLASYMLESIQAGFLLSGAVDEDHDQLKLLRDEVSRLVVQLDYLRNQIAADIQRQTTYLTTERSNLQAMAFAITRGELLGSSLANRPVIVAPSPVMMLPQIQGLYQRQSYYTPPAAAPAQPVTLGPPPMSPREYIEETQEQMSTTASTHMPSGDTAVAPTTGRLLVLVRFNQKNVDYEQQLSSAVNMALQRKADAQFSVIGITPARGDPAEIATMQESAGRNSENIKRSLIQLGLAPSRIVMGNTTSDEAEYPEVHVYIR